MPIYYSDKYTQQGTVLTEKYSSRGSSHTDMYTRNSILWDSLEFLWDSYTIPWDSLGVGTAYANKY